MDLKRGIAVSPGVAIGPALVLGSENFRIPQRFVRVDAVDMELARFSGALQAAVAEITEHESLAASRLGAQYGAIFAAHRQLAWRDVPPYIGAQLAGAVAGVLAAHAMFSLPLVQASGKARAGWALMGSEFVATLGLLAVVLIGVRRAPASVPVAVAGYIVAAYWFTASTSFANPVVTLARAMTDTFAGIGAGHVPGFLLAQAAAALVAIPVIGWMLGGNAAER